MLTKGFYWVQQNEEYPQIWYFTDGEGGDGISLVMIFRCIRTIFTDRDSTLSAKCLNRQSHKFLQTMVLDYMSGQKRDLRTEKMPVRSYTEFACFVPRAGVAVKMTF